MLVSFNISFINIKLPQKQEGFTILEVLVAMVLVSITLIAIAGGEITSLGHNRFSNELSLVTASGEEIIERMRRNRSNLAGYNGFDTGNLGTRPAAPGMLQTDYDQWQAGMLTGGVGTVQLTANTPIPDSNLVTVTITWPGLISQEVVIESILF